MSETRTPLFSVTLDDCRVDTFRSGGKGGQNQNKVESGVRIVHLASGAKGESRETRDQLENKRRAFRRMAESQTFQRWARIEASRRLTGKTIEQRVEEELQPDKLRVEVRNAEGKWELWAGEGTEGAGGG